MEAQWYLEPGFDVPLPYFDKTEPDPHEKALPKLTSPSALGSVTPENDQP